MEYQLYEKKHFKHFTYIRSLISQNSPSKWLIRYLYFSSEMEIMSCKEVIY